MSSESLDPKSAVSKLQPLALDSLLSPQVTSFNKPSPLVLATGRESVQEADFNDVALDDEAQFEPVALSARRSAFNAIPTLYETDTRGRPRSISLSSPTPSVKLGHRKSLSTSASASAKNIPLAFIVTGADTLKAGPSSASAGSSDSPHKLAQQQLDAEYAKLQNEKKHEAEEKNTIDWDFWGAVLSDYQQFATEHSEKLAQAIARGIPSTLRGMVWQLMAASKDADLEQTYLRLLKESSPHEKAIVRDLGRTFPHHAFFTDGQGIGQENLFNVLKAYSLYDPEVGYCQGLPFVVAILLLNMPDEEAFCLLVRFMYVYDLRGHFLPEMPKLQVRLYQFDRLLEELLPVLHIHFLRQGIKSSMFCSQWFLTLFSYRFPLDIVFRIYDNCLASGIEAIFGFSLTLLRKNEDLLLNLKFDEIITFLNTKLFDRYKEPNLNADGEIVYKVNEFVQDAVSMRITPFMLDNYSQEFEDIKREANKTVIEMEELRNTNRVLSQQVKSLESSLAQLSTEHVEVLNELVKSRIRMEEVEGELVRYKLLYAEAMHENEDAGSTQRLSGLSIVSLLSGKRGSDRSR